MLSGEDKDVVSHGLWLAKEWLDDDLEANGLETFIGHIEANGYDIVKRSDDNAKD